MEVWLVIVVIKLLWWSENRRAGGRGKERRGKEFWTSGGSRNVTAN